MSENEIFIYFGNIGNIILYLILLILPFVYGSMLEIFPKYLNFENILKKCIRVPEPLYRTD